MEEVFDVALTYFLFFFTILVILPVGGFYVFDYFFTPDAPKPEPGKVLKRLVSEVPEPGKAIKQLAMRTPALLFRNVPMTAQERDERLKVMGSRGSWREVEAQPGKIAFARSDHHASISLELTSSQAFSIDAISCQITPKKKGVPDDFYAEVEDDGDLFMQLFGDEPALTEGEVRFDGVTLRAPVAGFLRYCVDREALEALRARDEFRATRICVEDGSFTFLLEPTRVVNEGVVSPVERARVWDANSGAFLHAMDRCLELSRALQWSAEDFSSVSRAILAATTESVELWGVMVGHKLEEYDLYWKLGWLSRRALDPATPKAYWGVIIPKLLELDPMTRTMKQVFEHALEPENIAMAQVIFDNVDADFLMARFEGVDRVRWFEALVHANVPMDVAPFRDLIERLDPASLLGEELSAKARGVLLSKLLANGRDSESARVLTQLLRVLDDDDLVEVLRTLSAYGSVGIAKAVVVFVKNPKQIDTPREYQAMLMLLKSLSREHAELIRTPAVESFVCDGVLSPDERIASLALSLLESLGTDVAIERLLRVLDAPQLAIPSAGVGRMITKIRARQGQDLSSFAGGLSVAKTSGGELTRVAGDAGSITAIE